MSCVPVSCLVCSDTIMVEMSSPDLPDLTLIDLPGIVRTSTAGQVSHRTPHDNHGPPAAVLLTRRPRMDLSVCRVLPASLSR